MSWLQRSCNERFFKLAQEVGLQNVGEPQIREFIDANLEIEGYGIEWALFRGDAGTKLMLQPGEAKRVLTDAFMQVASSHNPTMQMINRDAMKGTPPFIEVAFDSANNLLVCNYNGMPVGQGVYQFSLAVQQKGITFQSSNTPKTQRQRTLNRRNRAEGLKEAPANDYLRYANEVGYLVGNGRIERDHPRHAGEKYTSSFHFTVAVRGNASRSRLFGMDFLTKYYPQEQEQATGLNAQEWQERESKGIRVTDTEGVEQFLDYCNLTNEIPLDTWRGATSDNIFLKDEPYRSAALKNLLAVTPAGISRDDVKEYFELGFQGELFD